MTTTQGMSTTQRYNTTNAPEISKGKAIIYIRVSTTKQAEEGLSLEVQEREARDYASKNDLMVKGVFRDEGKSGGSLKGRDQLQKSLDHLEKGDYFIVFSVSRLARNTKDFFNLYDVIQKQKGANLVSLKEKIDNTSSGKFMVGILALVSDWERSVCSERTKSIMESKKEKGEYTGGKIPYGSKLEKGVLVEDPNHRKVISKILKLRNEEGKSFRKIASTLEEDGIPCGSHSSKWHHYSVSVIYKKYNPRTSDA